MGISILFAMEHQAQDEWCWAAGAVSAATYAGRNYMTQCALANDQFGETSCCVNGGTARCNRPWYLDRALRAVGCSFQQTSQALSLGEIASTLGVGTAIEVAIGWTDGNGNFDGSGHIVAITGVDTSSQLLHIEDPWYYGSDVGYDDFVNRYQTVGRWIESYLIPRPSMGAGAPTDLTLKNPNEILGRYSRVPNILKRLVSHLPTSFRQSVPPIRSIMAKEVEAPLYTLTLDKAASGQPLSDMRQTGVQRINDQGVFQRAVTSAQFSVRAGVKGRSLSKNARSAMWAMEGAKVLQIPGLLVTVLVGRKAGKTLIKAIGSVPSFLDADQEYTESEFEAIIRQQAERKLRQLNELSKYREE